MAESERSSSLSSQGNKVVSNEDIGAETRIRKDSQHKKSGFITQQELDKQNKFFQFIDESSGIGRKKSSFFGHKNSPAKKKPDEQFSKYQNEQMAKYHILDAIYRERKEKYPD